MYEELALGVMKIRSRYKIFFFAFLACAFLGCAVFFAPIFMLEHPFLLICALMVPAICLANNWSPTPSKETYDDSLDLNDFDVDDVSPEKSNVASSLEEAEISYTPLPHDPSPISVIATPKEDVKKVQQLSLMDTNVPAHIHKNIFAQLFSQVEKMPLDSVSLCVDTSSGIENYTADLSVILRALHQPYTRQGLGVRMQPVFALPQRKAAFLNLEPILKLPHEGWSAKLSTLDVKPMRGLGGALNLLIFLKTLARIHEHLSVLPNIPLICDFPENVLEYPKLIQIFFDFIEPMNLPMHRFLWRISDGGRAGQSGFVNRLREMGSDFVVCLNYPRVDSTWRYLQLDLDMLHKNTKKIDVHQFEQDMSDFGSQEGWTILGNVHNLDLLEDCGDFLLDFAFGEALSDMQTIETFSTEKNLFTSSYAKAM